MSNLRYIIAIKNFEPAPPEYEYYCGTNATTGGGTARHLLNGAGTKDIIWDADRDAALKLRSEASAADSFLALAELGYSGMVVYKIAQVYTPVDAELFSNLVTKNKVDTIINGMEEDDVKYLKNLGVLDLTIVT